MFCTKPPSGRRCWSADSVPDPPLPRRRWESWTCPSSRGLRSVICVRGTRSQSDPYLRQPRQAALMGCGSCSPADPPQPPQHGAPAIPAPAAQMPPAVRGPSQPPPLGPPHLPGPHSITRPRFGGDSKAQRKGQTGGSFSRQILWEPWAEGTSLPWPPLSPERRTAPGSCRKAAPPP